MDTPECLLTLQREESQYFGAREQHDQNCASDTGQIKRKTALGKGAGKNKTPKRPVRTQVLQTKKGSSLM